MGTEEATVLESILRVFHSDLHLLRHLSFDRQAHVRRRSKLSCGILLRLDR